MEIEDKTCNRCQGTNIIEKVSNNDMKVYECLNPNCNYVTYEFILDLKLREKENYRL